MAHLHLCPTQCGLLNHVVIEAATLEDYLAKLAEKHREKRDMTGITIELTFSDRPRRSIPINTEAKFRALFRHGPLVPYSGGVWHQASDYDWPFKVDLYQNGRWMKEINFVDYNGFDPVPPKETGWERFWRK